MNLLCNTPVPLGSSGYELVKSAAGKRDVSTLSARGGGGHAFAGVPRPQHPLLSCSAPNPGVVGPPEAPARPLLGSSRRAVPMTLAMVP